MLHKQRPTNGVLHCCTHALYKSVIRKKRTSCYNHSDESWRWRWNCDQMLLLRFLLLEMLFWGRSDAFWRTLRKKLDLFYILDIFSCHELCEESSRAFGRISWYYYRILLFLCFTHCIRKLKIFETSQSLLWPDELHDWLSPIGVKNPIWSGPVSCPQQDSLPAQCGRIPWLLLLQRPHVRPGSSYHWESWASKVGATGAELAYALCLSVCLSVYLSVCISLSLA